MKTYTVYLSMTVDAYVEVEAESPEAALAEAATETNPIEWAGSSWDEVRIVKEEAFDA